jgi:hypothetical protein
MDALKRQPFGDHALADADTCGNRNHRNVGLAMMDCDRKKMRFHRQLAGAGW